MRHLTLLAVVCLFPFFLPSATVDAQGPSAYIAREIDGAIRLLRHLRRGVQKEAGL